MEIAEQRATILRHLSALDLRVALLRAEAGDPAYRAWLDFNRRYRLFDEASLDDLVQNAAVELSRLEASEQLRYRRHAAGTLAEGMALASRLGATEGFASLLVNFFPNLEGLSFDTPENAYVSAAFSTAPCSITNLQETFVFDDFQVSTATLEFDANRGIAEFAAKLDPRIWDVVAPETYEHTYRTNAAPNVPTDAPVPLETDAQEITLRGTAWNGLMYENARLPAGADEIMDFKNVLTIGFETPTATPGADQTLHVRYALDEALGLEILESAPFAGGLDRDSGDIFITETAANPGMTHHKVSKSARIAQPADRRDLLNWLMAISLRFWLKNMVLLGVCDNPNVT